MTTTSTDQEFWRADFFLRLGGFEGSITSLFGTETIASIALWNRLKASGPSRIRSACDFMGSS